MQLLVNVLAGLWDGISNAGSYSTHCVVSFEFRVGQAIEEVREGENKLLDVTSVDYGGLLLSLLPGGVERVSKMVTIDWLVKPMRVV